MHLAYSATVLVPGFTAYGRSAAHDMALVMAMGLISVLKRLPLFLQVNKTWYRNLS